MITLTKDLYPQPTLTLYLGGTGILVGEQLLTLMEELPPDARHGIEPFFIDAQEPKIVDHERARHYSYTDLGDFFQPVYEAFSRTRFPENLGESPVMNSSDGCGITRIFGTASLVAKRDDFGNLVEQAVARLTKRRRESTQPLQVFLTASACGGTGAGMILDAAAMVRHFFRLRGENPRIFLFLVGPSVFFEDPTIPLREEQRDRMRASTYALLKELHHFAQGKPFVSAYRLRDEVVEVGNARDDDRLFEWVYYIDGRPEQSGATRSLAEVAWTIAEAQIHLAVTEVGRKVAESMPNQREERMRGYAINFIHHDNKDLLTPAQRLRLEVSSRKTFLASLSVRSVRFPAGEIKSWFRWGWVREALRQALRRDRPAMDLALVDELDQILGYTGGAVQPQGLLAELGLSREQLLGRVGGEADPAQGVPAAIQPKSSAGRVIDMGEEIVRLAEVLLEDLKKEASLVINENPAEASELASVATLLRRASPRWAETWRHGLAPNGRIAERLWDLAWAPATGRGLQFLDGLLTHAARVLTDLAGEAQQRPSLVPLEEQIETARERLRALSKVRDREETGFRFLLRRIVGKATKGTVSRPLEQKSRMAVQQLNALRQELVEHRRRHIAATLAPRAWLDAATALKRWRDDVLAPAIVAADNAFTLADNEWQLARKALTKHRGTNTRGDWEAHTTVQLADDSFLESLRTRLANVDVADLVLAPMSGEGISRDRNRLTVRSLASIDRTTTVDMLFTHVEQATRGALTFLDDGWMLPDAAQRLRTSGARALDLGSEPLTTFSRSAVGTQLQSYLLKPARLLLPQPFGRRLDRMNPLISRDPMQLGVVSFVFGIPPNTLAGIGELFEQYTVHLGDQARNAAQDRFPMHVFRAAPETFDEPHSPLAFPVDDDAVASLIEAAKEIWGNDVPMIIRQFEETRLAKDWNLQVELTEMILQRLRRPGAALSLFKNGQFPDLQRLYNTRRYQAAETWSTDAGHASRSSSGAPQPEVVGSNN